VFTSERRESPLAIDAIGLSTPRLAEGEAANLAVFDAVTRWAFEERHIRSKSRNTPFVGFEMIGRAWAIYNKGRFVENEA
jgi:dihydroorotase